MEDSGYYSHGPKDFQVCSASDSDHNIFNIRFSDLPTSKYNYFLYGFKDEKDFEEFKQDLKDFQKLKRECSTAVSGNGDNGESTFGDLKEDLEFICRPNNVCKNRRKCHSGRNSFEGKSQPEVQSTYCPKQLLQPPIKAVDKVTTSEGKSGSCGSPKVRHRPLSKDYLKPTRDSFGLRGDFDRRSGLFGFERRSGITSSINDILMEFMNGDEHFQEFERVYETVNNRRMSKDMEHNRRMSDYRENRAPNDSGLWNGSPKDEDMASRFVDDIFADFFDNDETFLEFEKEFEKFKHNRRSHLLENLNNMGSSRDIFGDLKSYCDRNIKSNSGSLLSVSSCSSQDEATPDCGDDPESHSLIWRSVEDWEKMLRKMKRNSRLLLDSGRQFQHRHSVYGLSKPSNQPERYYKTQSLADLTRCHQDDAKSISPKVALDSPYSQSATDMSRASTCSTLHGGKTGDSGNLINNNGASVTQDKDEDSDLSNEQWLENSDENHYSSSSTLCSSNDDLSFSLSCSCCSDLHIEEDTDEDISFAYSRSPTSRNRSHSLMEIGNRTQPPGLGFHTSSVDNLHHCDNYRGNDNSFSKPHSRGSSRTGLCGSPSDTNSLSSHLPQCSDPASEEDDNNTHFYSDDPSRPPSALSSQLSDADSEQYHTADSDLSDQFSTAKSDLAACVSGPKFSSKLRFPSLDLSSITRPASYVSHDGDDYCDDTDPRSVCSGPYHSYHGKERTARYRQPTRPRSGSACQYTCHQHCVPAVTLDCKSISEDGVALIPARTPSPSDPRSNLETSLSIGNIYARPGSARSVSSGAGSNADTTSVASRSGSQPNVQHLVQGSPRGCNDPYLVTSSAAGHHGHVPSSSNPATPKHLSRSVSEGFVTANSSPAPVQNLTPHPVVAQGQHISPPPCSSAGSHQQTHSQTHSTGQSPSQLQQPVSSGDHVATKASHTDNTVNTSNRPEAVAAVADISHLHRPDGDANQEPGTEKDETDSGYRSGTIPDDQLPRVPSQATLDRQELKRKIAKFNHFVPAASLDATGKESFQGFLKVTMNLIRPITMELGARPPSIYELLTREHIIEENTQQVAFYMPRDTHKSLHITSDTTTKEVVTSLLKKFHILDHPRKFAMYEQEFSDRNKLVRLRRLNDKDFPLRAILSWDPERIKNYRVVLQENETGEIVWDAFSLPELNNFMKVLDREEKETILELKHKYAYMKQYMERRISELKNERHKQAKSKK